MATLVREYILNNDDSIDMGRWQKLMNTVGARKCERHTKSKKACGRPLLIARDGVYGCRFHEADYKDVLEAVSKLDKEEDDQAKNLTGAAPL
jgi:hypothetical protein